MKRETENVLAQVRKAFEDARSHGPTQTGEDPFYQKDNSSPEPQLFGVVLPKTGAGVVAPNPLPPRQPRKKQVPSQTLAELSAPLIKLLEDSNIVVHDFHPGSSHEIVPSNLLFQKGPLDRRCKKLYAQALKSLGSEESQ